MKSKSLNNHKKEFKTIKKTSSDSNLIPIKKSNTKINTFDKFIDYLLKF